MRRQEEKKNALPNMVGVSAVIWKVVALAFHHSFANFAEGISHKSWVFFFIEVSDDTSKLEDD